MHSQSFIINSLQPPSSPPVKRGWGSDHKGVHNSGSNNVGTEDRAQAQAFMDTWTWDDLANAGYSEILANAEGRFQPQLVDSYASNVEQNQCNKFSSRH